MTTGDLESQSAEQMRELARQYCDGAFNKGEYRRRRREILQRHVHQDYAPATADGEDDEPPVPVSVPPAPRDWLPLLMVGVTVVVAAMMGYLIYTIS
jgi:hypothetical protein